MGANVAGIFASFGNAKINMVSRIREIEQTISKLTNSADGYQIKNVDNAMMLNIGGSAKTNFAFIIGRE